MGADMRYLFGLDSDYGTYSLDDSPILDQHYYCNIVKNT